MSDLKDTIMATAAAALSQAAVDLQHADKRARLIQAGEVRDRIRLADELQNGPQLYIVVCPVRAKL